MKSNKCKGMEKEEEPSAEELDIVEARTVGKEKQVSEVFKVKTLLRPGQSVK